MTLFRVINEIGLRVKRQLFREVALRPAQADLISIFFDYFDDFLPVNFLTSGKNSRIVFR